MPEDLPTDYLPSHNVPSVPELIDRLFKTRLKPDGTEQSAHEVARAIKKAGGKIDASYLSKLRRGEAANPTRETLLRLCVFFRVGAAYFFPELEQFRTDDSSQADPAEQAHIAFHAMGLDPDVQKYLEGLIATLRPKKGDPQEEQ